MPVPMDAETEAMATYLAAALDDLPRRRRRGLWSAVRRLVAAVRGESWKPTGPYADRLAELAAAAPRRRVTSLGAQRGGVVNREVGGTRQQAPPWAAPPHPRRVWDSERKVMRPAYQPPRKRTRGEDIIRERSGPEYAPVSSYRDFQ